MVRRNLRRRAVPNHSLAGKCTINDLILDGERWSNHGQFVTHINEVVDQLVAAGVLRLNQRGSIVSTVARSSVGK